MQAYIQLILGYDSFDLGCKIVLSCQILLLDLMDYLIGVLNLISHKNWWISLFDFPRSILFDSLGHKLLALVDCVFLMDYPFIGSRPSCLRLYDLSNLCLRGAKEINDSSHLSR